MTLADIEDNKVTLETPELKCPRWSKVLTVFCFTMTPAGLAIATGLNFFSQEFHSPECWLEPNNGHWMTLNELLVVSAGYSAVLSLVLGVLVGAVLTNMKRLSAKWIWIGIAVSGGMHLIIFAANTLANPGYITRLYASCGIA